MRLDIDVLRDVLLFLEKNLEVKCDIADGLVMVKSNSIGPGELLDGFDEKRFRKRKPEAILYAVRMLNDAGLINKCVTVGADGEWAFSEIYDITFAGHEFLECIRNNDTWGKTKEIAKKAGCEAVTFLGQAASAVVSEAISGRV